MSEQAQDAPMHHGAPAHALERLVFFSDAVFAISITLLVIELKPPHLDYGAPNRDFLIALAQQTPHFIGFVVSFFVIGAFWTGHHRAFDCARHWHPKLIMPNLVLLLSVVGMPFFTAFMSEYYGRLVPSLIYMIWLLFVGVANLWNNSMAVSPGVAADDLDPEHAAMIKRRGWAIIFAAGTAIAACFIHPLLGQPALISIPLWRRVLNVAHERRRRRAAA